MLSIWSIQMVNNGKQPLLVLFVAVIFCSFDVYIRRHENVQLIQIHPVVTGKTTYIEDIKMANENKQKSSQPK